jgi:hypothetical protein
MKAISVRNSQAIKFSIIVVLIAFAVGGIFAQPGISLYEDAPEEDLKVIKESIGLTENGKWLSAWKLLADYDSASEKPFVLAEKIRIALNGYAQTGIHMVFGFVDLEEGQDLEAVRYESVADLEPFEFNAGDLSMALEDKGEAIPPVLSLIMGDYYHTVWVLYQGQWVQDDTTILSMAAEHYERALAYDTYSARSLEQYTEVLMALQRMDAAELVIQKALELDPANIYLTLQLANVYYSSQRNEEVFPLADAVIAGATDDQELNDGYIVAIKAGLGLGSADLLEKYVTGLEESFPLEYLPGLIRHLVAVRLENAEAADAAADTVTARFPGNPDVIRSLLSTWLSVQDIESGFKYLNRSIEISKSDEALASFYFYRALLGAEVAETKEALVASLEDVSVAEEYFAKVYPAEHEVFGMIVEIRAQWESALASFDEMMAEESEEAEEADATSAASDEGWEEESEDPDATSAASDEDW